MDHNVEDFMGRVGPTTSYASSSSGPTVKFLGIPIKYEQTLGEGREGPTSANTGIDQHNQTARDFSILSSPQFDHSSVLTPVRGV